MGKVYCKDCAYCNSIFPICNKADKRVVHIKENSYQPEEYITVTYNALIEDKNKNNDCKDFSKNLSTMFFEFLERIMGNGKDKQRII